MIRKPWFLLSNRAYFLVPRTVCSINVEVVTRTCRRCYLHYIYYRHKPCLPHVNDVKRPSTPPKFTWHACLVWMRSIVFLDCLEKVKAWIHGSPWLLNPSWVKAAAANYAFPLESLIFFQYECMKRSKNQTKPNFIISCRFTKKKSGLFYYNQEWEVAIKSFPQGIFILLTHESWLCLLQSILKPYLENFELVSLLMCRKYWDIFLYSLLNHFGFLKQLVFLLLFLAFIHITK